jgi:hypothetical protein
MSVHRELNDAIEGDRVACQFRKKNSEKLIPMTGGHRGTRMIISGNVYCVIETAFIRTS